MTHRVRHIHLLCTIEEMKLIKEVKEGTKRIVIFEKVLGYRIEMHGFQESTRILKCSRSKGKDPGVFLYYPLNDLRIRAIADFTIQKELVISISNGPEITMSY